MNQRVLAFVAVAALVLGAGVYLLMPSAPKPAPEADSAAARPAPAPAPRPRATPAPAPAPAPAEPARPREARPRTPAPAPEPAAPAPAEAPAADAVTLRIETDVPDAQVFVDRNFLGKSPVTTTEVKPGTHQLNVSATGFDGVAQSIDVKPGSQQITVKLREVKLNAAIDVVHKHRMGSCKGRLIATPQGLRYDTTDKDDAFRTPLMDMETFEVDYLEKNLRIKLKGGKSFNFTEPSGNADKLFVFQRDVQKARERLKKGDTPAAE
ncbi:MAG: PEGA domain-containing protein [Vicinamibacterales bacterium]